MEDKLVDTGLAKFNPYIGRKVDNPCPLAVSYGICLHYQRDLLEKWKNSEEVVWSACGQQIKLAFAQFVGHPSWTDYTETAENTDCRVKHLLLYVEPAQAFHLSDGFVPAGYHQRYWRYLEVWVDDPKLCFSPKLKHFWFFWPGTKIGTEPRNFQTLSSISIQQESNSASRETMK